MRSRMRRWSHDVDLPSLEEEARNEVEWRAMTPRQRAWGMAGAILLLSPILLSLALIPVALNADTFGVDQAKVERLMFGLFIGGIALMIVVTILATLWAKFNPRPDPRAPERGP
jgi:hypothetical protein